MSSVGTKYTTNAATEEKARTLARKNPSLGKYVGDAFGVSITGAESTAGAINKSQQALDRYTRNVVQTLFSVELKAQDAIAAATEPVTSGISNLGNEAVAEIQGVKESLNKLLSPISSATGSTLGTLTNVARNPLGAPSIIGSSLSSLVRKVNPDFVNSLDATYKKYKMTELQNLPGQAFGSIRNLATAADSILSVPFAMASDLYNGLMDIMKEISNLIDSVVSAVFDLFFGPQGILDSIIPIAAIMEFADAVSELSATVGAISQLTGGFATVANFIGQVDIYTNQIADVISNPVQLATQFVPTEVTQGITYLRSPDQLLSNLVPPSILNQMQKISQIPGLGFVGNLGYSIGGTLEDLSQGVITRTLNDFEQQLGILSPLLNIAPKATPVSDTQQSYVPSANSALTNPKILVVQGVPIQTELPPKVLPTIESRNKSKTTSSITAYGMTETRTSTINVGAR